MMGLRKTCGITEAEYKKAFGEKLPQSFVQLAEKWSREGLFEITCDNADTACDDEAENCKRYKMNKKGMLFLNRFLSELEI